MFDELRNSIPFLGVFDLIDAILSLDGCKRIDREVV
jgi:hypothetical protein